MLGGILFAHQEMQVIISGIKEMASEVGKPTFEYVPKTLDKELVSSVKDSYSNLILDAYQIQDKQERVQTLNQLKEKIVEAVKRKEIHIDAIKRIEEGIEILIGVKASRLNSRGNYEQNTVFGLVEKKLKDFYSKTKSRQTKLKHKKTAVSKKKK